jgi:hypothetical protein
VKSGTLRAIDKILIVITHGKRFGPTALERVACSAALARRLSALSIWSWNAQGGCTVPPAKESDKSQTRTRGHDAIVP